jgi:hypothetical protein
VPFVEKQWVDDLAEFAGKRPEGRYMVARSNGTCASADEARTQAMQEASQQVSQILWNRGTPSPRPPAEAGPISPWDLQNGGFIVDQFAQSFDGSAGKIWRQAMLIDISTTKLGWLANRTVKAARPIYWPWVQQIGSALGVFVLILVTYFFLNLATRGYYEWSLRIAGVVLVVLMIVVFLHLKLA